jgi:molybdopterin-guanine dinucleotide biosynthesis protein A
MTAKPRRRAAIVLAGGASRRFGRDKLAEPVRRRPMLDHAILAVATIVSEVLVVGAAGPAGLPLTPGTTTRRLPDERPGAGPLGAVATALAGLRDGTALVVAGDMPDLVGPVLELLLGAVERSGTQAAVLLRDGGPVPLPLAVDVEAAAPVARAALDAGESSLRSLLGRLIVTAIDEPAWRALDPEATSLRDVDREADLAETERRPRSRPASCGK